MNEKDLRQNFVDTACSYSGCNEADGSHRLIVDMYNNIKPLPAGYKLSYTDAWCAAFVSAMATKCGLLDIVFAECSCDRMIALYQAAGRWQEADDYTPQPGDLVFYDWQDGGQGDNRGGADHVGIVVAVSGLTLKILEGNMSDAVGYRNLVVGARYIRGFALPDFEGAGGTVPKVDTSQPAPVKAQRCAVELPVLRRGATGTAVAALQRLLVGRGQSVGPDGADGDFGANTEKALLAFQQGAGLSADGVAGSASWSALIEK